MKNATILGSLRSDVLFFYGLSFILLLGMMTTSLWENSLITLGVLVLLDMGHAYATLFRTYFRKKEFKRSKIYIYAPVFFLVLMCAWAYSGLPFFWRFMLYATFIHHVRQNFGLYMWYSKLEGVRPRYEKLHIHLMALIPFILFHFRGTEYEALYHFSEFIPGEASPYIRILIGGYTIYFFYNMVSMFLRMTRKEVGSGLALSFIYPACLNYVCFLMLNHSYQVYMPLLAFHAVSYLALMSHSMDKLHEGKTPLIKIWGLLMTIVIFFVSIEYFITDYFEVFSIPTQSGNFKLSLVMALAVLPNLMHFFLDSVIWKKENPDFQMILK
jgi:hypothetical protein